MINKYAMKQRYKRTLKQAIIGTLLGLFGFVTSGCGIAGYSATAELGRNMPTKQSGYSYPEATSYGAKFGVESNKTIGKTGRGIEGRVGVSTYTTSVSDAILTDTVNATRLEGQVLVPVWGNDRVTVYAGAHGTSQGEEETASILGTSTSDTRTITGVGLDLVARIAVSKGCDIEASVGTTSFGSTSGDGTASRDEETNLNVGATFYW
jgi:hypothetical protein